MILLFTHNGRGGFDVTLKHGRRTIPLPSQTRDDLARVRIEWRSKAPHTTRFLVIDHPDTLPPGKLLSELEEIGFAGDGLLGPSPVNGRRETTVGKRGTGLFGGWTPAERRQNVAAAQKILTANGFSTPRWRKLTAAELL